MPAPTLVCTLEDDGSFVFNGDQETFTSREVWDNGSVTYHWIDGSQYTTAGYSDPAMIAYILGTLCGTPDQIGG